MHTNYRRKKRARSGYYGWRRWHRIPTLVYWKRLSQSERRMQVAKLLHSERYDSIPTRYRRDILWHLL